MKGPGMRLDLDIRRVWRCPACGREARSEGQIVTRFCGCTKEGVAMRLVELPRTGADVMSHRDLIPANLLARGGRLAGVLDSGGFGPADPSLDLVAAWHLLDDRPRTALRSELECDDLEWSRGAAWALQQAMGLVWYYRESNPAMSELGASTLRRIMASDVLEESERWS